MRGVAAKLGILLRSREEILKEKGPKLWGLKRKHEDGAFLAAMSEVTG